MKYLYGDAYAARCLAEITDLVKDRHRRLEESGLEEFQQGGCLVLGNSYAKSPYLYLGINPGWPAEWNGELTGTIPMDVGPCSEDSFNSPFINDQNNPASRKAPFWRNCHDFFARHHRLRQWINNGVTSAFACPWRTRDAAGLWSLNQRTDGKLFEYSAEILNLMFDHHRTEVLIIAGKHTITTLRAILSASPVRFNLQDWSTIEFEGPGKTYTWSQPSLTVKGSDVMLLQIPHFSRACSQQKLDRCAQWLAQKLEQEPRCAH
jgi:hypothetical protein